MRRVFILFSFFVFLFASGCKEKNSGAPEVSADIVNATNKVNAMIADYATFDVDSDKVGKLLFDTWRY